MNAPLRSNPRVLGVTAFVCFAAGVVAPFAAQNLFAGTLVPILIAYVGTFCLVALAVILGILGWRDPWAKAAVIGVGLFLVAVLGGYYVYTDLMHKKIPPADERNDA